MSEKKATSDPEIRPDRNNKTIIEITPRLRPVPLVSRKRSSRYRVGKAETSNKMSE